MIIEQRFDPASSTFTYLVGDPNAGEAALIDPVAEHTERDRALVAAHGLSLRYVLETHAHADHITGASALRTATGAVTGVSQASGIHCADLQLRHGQRLRIGSLELEVRATPGHTSGCTSYVLRQGNATYAFTGDALLIGGSGRTDFQGGSARSLYRSVHEQLYTLPDSTVVFPGHDYQGRRSSTIGREKRDNARLALDIDEATFVDIMRGLELPPPRKIDIALPANLACGAGR